MMLALIRGINVGGHKKIAMSDLRAFVESCGFGEVQSLLQSGNVVFSSDRRSTAEIERCLEENAPKRLGIDADFFVRSGGDWERLVADNPFRQEAIDDPGHLVLMCLKKAPDPADVKALKAAIPGREVLRASGKHLYVVFPDGIGTSRLTNAMIERKLKTRGTARNWNTVLKLHALAASNE
jgi:uncharacterized protein (DUF1697 family)